MSGCDVLVIGSVSGTDDRLETRRAFVHEAELGIAGGEDPGAPGGAVTRLLCGRHDHAGKCRWPHNNAIDVTASPARFRTLFVATEADEAEIRARIDRALRGNDAWSVMSSGSRPVVDAEQPLVRRLIGIASPDSPDVRSRHSKTHP